MHNRNNDHQPLMSVIIVSFNNFETTTGPCLESLITDKAGKNMEIIVVDNNSSDGTAQQLGRIEKQDSRIRMLFNKENRGFAGGVNDGVRIAEGSILILLNSDTIAPPGTLNRLAEMFSMHKDWDMLGPMTNDVGNDQRIFTTSHDLNGILKEGKEWCTNSHDFFYQTDLLGFFCLTIAKETYQHLGGLDELFGLGFFEDTDFCIRAKKAGLKMIVTEDLFIYHKGSASFFKKPKLTRDLLHKNKKLLQKKHPGALRSIKHNREKNLDVMKEYVSLIKDTGLRQDLKYKFRNRLRTAETLSPNNILKRLGYRRRLNRLVSSLSFMHEGK